MRMYHVTVTLKSGEQIKSIENAADGISAARATLSTLDVQTVASMEVTEL